MNLRTVKAYLLKEDFQRFWDYTYPAWAAKFLHRWCSRAVCSQIEPMKNIATMLRRHQPLILNWFRTHKQFNSGIVEGLNLKRNLTVRKAFGFRTLNALQVASFHQLGDFPLPPATHDFSDEAFLEKLGPGCFWVGRGLGWVVGRVGAPETGVSIPV